jgi:hypothetical protein
MYLISVQPVKSSKTLPTSLLSGPRGRDLRRTWLRLALFLLPIFVFVVPLVYCVDPFGLFAKPSVIPETTRSKYAQQMNQVLWKLPAYGRDPAPNILLGDSQMARLPDQAISAITGQKYSNLAYGGGTLREAVSTFWFASQKVGLRKVFFGVSFMEYNAYPMNRVTQTEEVVNDPALYFLNTDVLEAAEYDIDDAVFQHPVNLLPQESKDAFWSSQLQYLTTRYKRASSPGNLRDELRKIIDYGHSQGISVVFVIPPQHIEAQRRIQELGIEGQYRQFKSDLESMAPVYDCDIDSPLTREKNNYGDPFHLTDSAAKKLVQDIWSENPRWCRLGAD